MAATQLIDGLRLEMMGNSLSLTDFEIDENHTLY